MTRTYDLHWMSLKKNWDCAPSVWSPKASTTSSSPLWAGFIYHILKGCCEYVLFRSKPLDKAVSGISSCQSGAGLRVDRAGCHVGRASLWVCPVLVHDACDSR